MVFCNTVPSCDWTTHHLKCNGIPVVKLHAGFSPMVSQVALPVVSPSIWLVMGGRSLGTILGYLGECSLLAQCKCYCCPTKFAVFSVVQDRKNLLKEFTNGKARVLVCTDIASRGIDSTQVRGLPTLTLHCCYQYTLLWRRYTHTHTITHTHTHRSPTWCCLIFPTQ